MSETVNPQEQEASQSPNLLQRLSINAQLVGAYVVDVLMAPGAGMTGNLNDFPILRERIKEKKARLYSQAGQIPSSQ